MEENLNNINIDEILEKLNSPEMSDTIKNIMGSFSNVSESSSTDNTDFSNILSSLSGTLSSSNLGLLTALKPYVNKNRQKKIDQCEKFVSMINAFSLMNNLTKDENI